MKKKLLFGGIGLTAIAIVVVIIALSGKNDAYRSVKIIEVGIYDICDNIIKNYSNIPFYISENGMGVENEERFINEKGQIEDIYRIDFVKGHLKKLHKGILAGANCFGYHM